ncbi:hypothetical protein [Photorhabdus sp. CRCIA-P01]|uniref:hypothetical protein n=1 Tax=Photorhabdus sp. CRCIA-P01 TaxID=2019570 RepID=UPI0013008C01|nr:hypothetical protein [Photorhabdus sp. CRCIA-P01]
MDKIVNLAGFKPEQVVDYLKRYGRTSLHHETDMVVMQEKEKLKIKSILTNAKNSLIRNNILETEKEDCNLNCVIYLFLIYFFQQHSQINYGRK